MNNSELLIIHSAKQQHGNAPNTHVLVIYTGGTFGMIYDNQQKSLVPFDFKQIQESLPEINRLDFDISVFRFKNLLDSANMKPENWVEIAQIIQRNYEYFDGFVVLHGTDTMAYTASALSFMLENLNKPVIFTGAQLPIGVARTDAKENFITALEIATARNEAKQPMISEVCIFFNSVLLRGNRAKKKESSQFNAFRSENYPILAEAGSYIEYNFPYLKSFRSERPLALHTSFEINVLILKFFPGISHTAVSAFLSIKDLKGVVLETFGSGNAPTDAWLLELLHTANANGIILVNVSQCDGGRVLQDRYQTGKALQEAGVLSGNDITTEAAITKLMFLLGQGYSTEKVKYYMCQPLAGEMGV